MHSWNIYSVFSPNFEPITCDLPFALSVSYISNNSNSNNTHGSCDQKSLFDFWSLSQVFFHHFAVVSEKPQGQGFKHGRLCCSVVPRSIHKNWPMRAFFHPGCNIHPPSSRRFYYITIRYYCVEMALAIVSNQNWAVVAKALAIML